jgi:hypothetical protein
MGNRIRSAGARGLVESGGLPALAHLDLRHNPIGDTGALVLAQCRDSARLRVLDLYNCSIRDEGGQALADSPWLSDLAQLDLDCNELDEDTQAALRERFGDRVHL